jgi:hypothetical protein
MKVGSEAVSVYFVSVVLPGVCLLSLSVNHIAPCIMSDSAARPTAADDSIACQDQCTVTAASVASIVCDIESNPSDPDAMARLCDASTSEQATHCLVNEQINVLATLTSALSRTTPNEHDAQLYRPTLDNDTLGALLEAAKSGQVPRIAPPSHVDLSHEAVRMRNHDAIRRHAIVTLRNIAQNASLRPSIIECPGLLDEIFGVFRNASETGLVLHYAATIVRCILTVDASHNTIDRARIAAERAVHNDNYKYMIGNAATRRTITLPEGRALVVHIECARALAKLIACAADEYLVLFVQGLAMRPLCEAVLSTPATIVHYEMAVGMSKPQPQPKPQPKTQPQPKPQPHKIIGTRSNTIHDSNRHSPDRATRRCAVVRQQMPQPRDSCCDCTGGVRCQDHCACQHIVDCI